MREISKIIEVKGEGVNSVYSLKKRDVEYYVVGIHPAFAQPGVSVLGRFFLSAPFFMVSFGILPAWAYKPVVTRILVYDNKLNFLGEKTYNSDTEYTVSWWGNKEEGTFFGGVQSDESKLRLFAPDIQEISDNFPSLLESFKK